jgi:hypothetical protein
MTLRRRRRSINTRNSLTEAATGLPESYGAAK